MTRILAASAALLLASCNHTTIHGPLTIHTTAVGCDVSRTSDTDAAGSASDNGAGASAGLAYLATLASNIHCPGGPSVATATNAGAVPDPYPYPPVSLSDVGLAPDQ